MISRLLCIAVSVALAACAPAARQIATTPSVALDASTARAVQISAGEYLARRTSLAELVGNGLVVAFGSPEPAADYLEFFQNANFRYLTGIGEPEGRLVMEVRDGRAATTLFVRERDHAREVWEGYRLGIVRAAEVTGIPTRVTEDFSAALDTLLARNTRVLLVFGEDVPGEYLSPATRLRAELRSRGAFQVNDGNSLVEGLRARKTPTELALLREAVNITVRGHAAAARAIAPGRHEYAVEAALEAVFRAAGAERTSFASIVGSGPNSTVLHYNRNDRLMRAGDVVVVDIGASWRGYAGDVTRTYPTSGRFTPEQREVYQIVRDAQAAAEGAALPGASAAAMNAAANRVIRAGLARLGLTEEPEATYECDGPGSECPQHRLYYMHGLGHAIGLDVHDPGTSGVQSGTLAPGDIFTIEPGIYVRRQLLDIIPSTPRNEQIKARIRAAVERYADIGVRIEDDYLVTETGLEWLSRFPREIAEIEGLMNNRR